MGLREELQKMSKKSKESQWAFIPDLCRKAASEGQDCLLLSKSKVPGQPPAQTLALYLGLDVDICSEHGASSNGEKQYKITWQPRQSNER
jgi:hypothetical protein